MTTLVILLFSCHVASDKITMFNVFLIYLFFIDIPHMAHLNKWLIIIYVLYMWRMD